MKKKNNTFKGKKGHASGKRIKTTTTKNNSKPSSNNSTFFILSKEKKKKKTDGKQWESNICKRKQQWNISK